MDFQPDQSSADLLSTTDCEHVRNAESFDGLNESEARKLGLEKIELTANPVAQNLMARIFDTSRADYFDMTTEAGQIAFRAAWTKTVPNITPPCVRNFWYLEKLQVGKIISNLDLKNPVPLLPKYDCPKIIWMQSWTEQNFNANDELVKQKSLLLQELGIVEHGVVNASRLQIDAALWLNGDPSLRKKSDVHIAILKKLNLDSTKYQFRLITQDEYARAATIRTDFFTHAICTHYDGYPIEETNDAQYVSGLFGGYRDGNGPARIGSDPRDHVHDYVATRLILEKL